jgi:hypothetical protein
MVNNVEYKGSNFLWRSLCLNYVRLERKEKIADEEIDNINIGMNALSMERQEGTENVSDNAKEIVHWKHKFISLVSYDWDTLAVHKSRYVLYSNDNRSVENPQDPNSSYWATARTRKLLKPGGYYCWDFVLDKFKRASHNLWWIIVGVETPNFPFQNQNGDDVIGYQSHHHGVGLIIGRCEISHRGLRFKDNSLPSINIEQGDIIRIEFDMRMSSEKSDQLLNDMHLTDSSHYLAEHIAGARMHFTRIQNGKKDKLTTVNNIRGLKFYPTVSMNKEMKVSIRSFFNY